MEYVIIWIICGVIAGIIGTRKGQRRSAFVIGFLFGPLGIVLALVRKGDRRECPHCRELVHQEARACPHCQRVVSGKLSIRCPHCGQCGAVTNFAGDDKIECPSCKHSFLAKKALVD